MSGPLVNVATSTSASGVEESTRGSTAPFLRAQASVPSPPPRLARGDGSEPAGSLVVHSVNSFSACLVPVSVGRRLVSGPLPDPKHAQVNVAVSVFSPLVSVNRVSPLVLCKFRVELVNHPDRSAVAYVLSGVQFGFQVGFAAPSGSLKSASSNMRSSLEHPSIIDEYLKTEVSLGWVAGPFSSPPFPILHISRFGAIPKSNQPGKWRLILDLSTPAGHSVNDGISKPPYSIQYVTVDAFIDCIMARGRGTLMAKFDVASTYRIIAVHPQVRYLLGMKWHDSFFVDLALPFGLRLAPFIFTAVADMVEWILVNNHGVDFLRHYLDNFLTLGPPASSVCSDNLRSCIQLCTELGLPLNPDKLEGPSTCLTILGIELDSVKLQA